jgi:hypothetical protein
MNRREFVVAGLAGIAALAGCETKKYSQPQQQASKKDNSIFLYVSQSNGELYFSYHSNEQPEVVFRVGYSSMPEGSRLDSIIGQLNPGLSDKTVSAISDIAYALAENQDAANLKDGQMRLIKLNLPENRSRLNPSVRYPIPMLETSVQNFGDILTK